MTRKTDDLLERWCSGAVKAFITNACTKKPTGQRQNIVAANLLRDTIDEAAYWKRRYLKLASEVQREGVQ